MECLSVRTGGNSTDRVHELVSGGSMRTTGAMQETKRSNPNSAAWGEVTAEVQELLH